jgi:hypothetical protein
VTSLDKNLSFTLSLFTYHSSLLSYDNDDEKKRAAQKKREPIGD